VLTGLDDYLNKKPGSTLAALEKFISDELTVVELTNCLQATVGEAATSDYFGTRLGDLRRALRQRCEELQGELGDQNYSQVASFFNQRLAGRFPFATPPVAPAVAAEPVDLKAFFQRFDQTQELLESLSAEPLPAADRRRPKTSGDFVRAMAAVRPFFAHYLDAEPPVVEPVYDFDVEFRVHRQVDDGSNQIIDWQLEVLGYDTITYRDAERRGRWVRDRPLRLTLRWARDSLQVPRSAVGGVVEGDTVIFTFRNRWSLLELLASHASSPSDFDQPAEVLPHTLKFEIETEPRPAEELTGVEPVVEVPEGKVVRVFVRVGLATPESKEPLTIPIFPERAPSWGGDH
jgi:type VI secretion system protein ImpL